MPAKGVWMGIAAALGTAAGLWASGAQAANGVVFQDDFQGPRLDRGKWNVVLPEHVVNNEQQAYVDSGETLQLVKAQGAEDGAALSIRAVFKPGSRLRGLDREFDFASARLDTRGKFQFAYGTAAARIRMTAGQGLWPAFWILGPGKWPDTGEIDVMENVGEADWVSSALHGPGYFGDTPLVKRFAFPAAQDVTGWHVYSVDWSPQALVFRVDGVETYRVSRQMVEEHGRWAFDEPKYLILNLALGGSYPQGVNKVTAPYPGLPQATVDLIKAGKAQLLVDWVRVTRAE